MNEQHAQLSWAGRVRSGIRNPFEYNKDCELTCKLVNVKDRSDIFNLLREVRFSTINFEGIVLRSGYLVDFTLKNKSYSLKLAKLLKENDKVQEVIAYAESNVDVRIAHVPPRFPETPLFDYIQLNHGQIIKTFRQKDCYNLETGVRIFKLEQKDLENNPIPSFLFFEKYKLLVKYEGQKQTCGFCAKAGHNEKDSERKYQLKLFKTGSNREIMARTTISEAGPKPGINDTTNENDQTKQSYRTIASSSCDQLDTNIEKLVQRSTSKSQSPERQNCSFCNETRHNEKDCERKKSLELVRKTKKLRKTSRITTGKTRSEPKAKDTLNQNEPNERNCKTIASSSCGQLETNKEQLVEKSTNKSQPFERQHVLQDEHFEAGPTITQDKTCFSKSTTSISTEKQHIIMTSEPITTTQQQLSTNNDKEIQQRQDTNQINEIFEDDKEIIMTQKRESNKRQRSDSKSDRISPLYKTCNIENLNNSPSESSIFKTQ